MKVINCLRVITLSAFWIFWYLLSIAFTVHFAFSLQEDAHRNFEQEGLDGADLVKSHRELHHREPDVSSEHKDSLMGADTRNENTLSREGGQAREDLSDEHTSRSLPETSNDKDQETDNTENVDADNGATTESSDDPMDTTETTTNGATETEKKQGDSQLPTRPSSRANSQESSSTTNERVEQMKRTGNQHSSSYIDENGDPTTPEQSTADQETTEADARSTDNPTQGEGPSKFLWVQNASNPENTAHEEGSSHFVWVNEHGQKISGGTETSKSKQSTPDKPHDDDLIQEEEIMTEYSAAEHKVQYHTDGTPYAVEDPLDATGNASAIHAESDESDAIKSDDQSAGEETRDAKDSVGPSTSTLKNHAAIPDKDGTSGDTPKKTPGSLASFFDKVNEKEKHQDPRLSILSTSAEMKPATKASNNKTAESEELQQALQGEVTTGAQTQHRTWGKYSSVSRPANLHVLSLLFTDELADDATSRLKEIYDAPTLQQLEGPVSDEDLKGADGEANEETSESNSADDGHLNKPRSVNTVFVEGLDDLDKFFEGVDPPDELDVGAAGTSIQDVLMGQTTKIIIKRVKVGFNYVVKTCKALKDRVSQYFAEQEGSLPEWFANQRALVSNWFAENKDELPSVMKEHLFTTAKWSWTQMQRLSQMMQDVIDKLLDRVGDDDAVDGDADDMAEGLDALEKLKRSRGL